MASIDRERPSPSQLLHSDAEAVTSYDSSNDDERPPVPARNTVCPWRTGEFDNQECSRYFDCPSHQIKRAQPEDEDEEESSGEEEEEEEQHLEEEEEEETDSGSGSGSGSDDDDVSPLSDEGPVGEQMEVSDEPDIELPRVPVQAEVIDLTSPERDVRHGAHRSPVTGDSTETQSLSTQAAQSRTEVIDLINNQTPSPAHMPPPMRSIPRNERALPPPPAPTPANQMSGESSRADSAQRRPTPPLPPSPTRRRISMAEAIAGQQDPRTLRRSSEIVLPRWQPDAEVTICPICHTQFSIFVRKHHCRKCGRVVCNACSPHRITIPYQYIVQPPGTPRVGAQRYPSSLISGEGGYADFSSLGGGERVRLCNPCVPDPNTNPPQSRESLGSGSSHSRSQSSHSGGVPNLAPPRRPTSYFGYPGQDAYGRNRSVTMQAGGSRPGPGSRAYQSHQSRIMGGTPPNYHPYNASSSSSSSAYPGRHRSMVDIGPLDGQSSSRPLPPDPPQLAEEDECPVCHRELPPRDLPNFEAQREAHINICITSHSTYGSTPTGVGGESSRVGGVQRRTGMFPYTATEKDCVDSAECTICLEEFEVGVPMARLECLCRFHRTCISRWFAKNPGRCPVHQHGDY